MDGIKKKAVQAIQFISYMYRILKNRQLSIDDNEFVSFEYAFG